MALYKQIESSNGVSLLYHRIIMILIETNNYNMIKVGSYISKSKRYAEKKATENNESYSTYIEEKTYPLEYDQTMTIASAYEWLKKNVDEFKDATDILEDETLAISE